MLVWTFCVCSVDFKGNLYSEASWCSFNLSTGVFCFILRKIMFLQKKLPGRLKDDKSGLYADGISGQGDMGRPQSTGFKSFGTQRKDKKEFQLDSREQQVHLQNL